MALPPPPVLRARVLSLLRASGLLSLCFAATYVPGLHGWITDYLAFVRMQPPGGEMYRFLSSELFEHLLALAISLTVGLLLLLAARRLSYWLVPPTAPLADEPPRQPPPPPVGLRAVALALLRASALAAGLLALGVVITRTFDFTQYLLIRDQQPTPLPFSAFIHLRDVPSVLALTTIALTARRWSTPLATFLVPHTPDRCPRCTHPLPTPPSPSPEHPTPSPTPRPICPECATDPRL